MSEESRTVATQRKQRSSPESRPAETMETRSTETGETRSVSDEVEIAASPERVWRALTEAAELERWFPLEARVEPGAGGSIYLSWKNEYAGESRILAWDPPRHLRISWGALDDTEGVAQVTDFHIEGGGGRARLRVVTSGFPADASWDEWVEGTRRGWRYELTSLRHYLEAHADSDRQVVYLRRRVPLSPEAAWGRLFGPDGFDPETLGRTFDEAPPHQYATVMDDPPGAMLRLSTEPCGPGVDARDVTLFLSAWGDHGPRLEALRGRWSELLERLFPEGETV